MGSRTAIAWCSRLLKLKREIYLSWELEKVCMIGKEAQLFPKAHESWFVMPHLFELKLGNGMNNC